jgi:hypothetical protein
MVANIQQIHIAKNGTATPDPCTLSKSGQGFPKRAVWVADDKDHDIHVIFEAENPFKKQTIVVKRGGPEDSDDIRTEAQASTYHYRIESKAMEVAADPEIVIKN